MACGCQKAAAQTYQYTDSDGNVFTGRQIEMRAQQIRDQRAGKPAGTLQAQVKAPSNA